ncbi:MAG: hypothetical protein H6974_03885 [Gammaproteobacteria bacterium]|nr:hypothetical protein [Gammaproteobacteria bacterium]
MPDRPDTAIIQYTLKPVPNHADPKNTLHQTGGQQKTIHNRRIQKRRRRAKTMNVSFHIHDSPVAG